MSNNSTHFDPDDCTLDTCSLEYANPQYQPSLPGNAAYAGAFGLLLIAQIFFGIRHKTWTFLAGLAGGIVVEILGYVGRLQLHSNPFSFNAFVMQLVCLTIAPAFLTAGIYVCLTRIIVAYGQGISRLRPRTYTYIFMSCDFVSLVLQSAGGAITSMADDSNTSQMGVNIMIAGLIFQVVALSVFGAVCCDFALRVRRRQEWLNDSFTHLRAKFVFKGFLFALVAATVLIFVRSVFRVAELWQGFNGYLANHELTFMIFEGPMIILACAFLTVFHPGISFGGRWAEAQPAPRKSKRSNTLLVMNADASSSYELIGNRSKAGANV
ncbi:putative RTA1 domain protein [Thozetella sp. PMI_491]|nr:putative RTA1 domain protein [Thozetella sp. PMI_491]